MPDIRPWDETLADAGSALLPGWAQATKIVLDQVYARHVQRAETTLMAIVEATSPERLGECLDEFPVLEATFSEALETASRTGLDAKRRLLAQVVARAVLDDARIDEAALMTSVLREIDAPHVRVLEQLVRIEDEVEVEAAERARQENPEPWTRWYAAGEFLQTVSTPVHMTLVRTGCVKVPQSTITIVDVFRVVTPFGRALLQDLHQHARATAPISEAAEPSRP